MLLTTHFMLSVVEVDVAELAVVLAATTVEWTGTASAVITPLFITLFITDGV